MADIKVGDVIEPVDYSTDPGEAALRMAPTERPPPPPPDPQGTDLLLVLIMLAGGAALAVIVASYATLVW